jgi:hypothetical protein
MPLQYVTSHLTKSCIPKKHHGFEHELSIRSHLNYHVVLRNQRLQPLPQYVDLVLSADVLVFQRRAQAHVHLEGSGEKLYIVCKRAVTRNLHNSRSI